MAASYYTENFYRSLIDRSTDIIFLLEKSGNIHYASPSVTQALGTSPDSLVGKNLCDLAHPQDAPYIKRELEATDPEDPAGFGVLCRLQHLDRSWHTFEGFARNLLADPFVQGMVIYLHDVTNRRRAEETLQRSVTELARSNAFIAALSQVAERIATSTNPDQVMETLGREMEGISLACAVMLVDSEENTLKLHYISIKPSVLDLVEQHTSLDVRGYQIGLDTLPPQASPLQPEFHSDIIPYLAGVMMNVPQNALVRAVRLAGVIPFTPFVCLPLKVRERILGNLAVWGAGLHEGDIKGLSVFANQLAGMIDKAILLDTVQRRVQETDTLREAAAVVTSALDLDQVLERILTQLARVIPYDSAAVFLLEEDRLRITACRGIEDPGAVVGQSFSTGELPFQEIVHSSKPLILADVQIGPTFRGLCNSGTARGWMGIPLMVRGVLIGILTLESRRVAAYGAEKETLAETFANQAAIAIENARLFKQVQHLAITDTLTGLYNRRHFFELASREFERSRRYGHTLSLLMWDIDHFKLVNDNFGHLIGDQVLQKVTQRCRDHLREIDSLGRYGGDEFVALLPETDLEHASPAAERLCQAIPKDPFIIGDKSVTLSISLGIAELDESCSSLEMLLDRADQALYLAKQAGRNCVVAWPKP